MNLKNLSLIFLICILLVNGCGDLTKTPSSKLTSSSTPAETSPDEVVATEDITKTEPEYFPQIPTQPSILAETPSDEVVPPDNVTRREPEYSLQTPTPPSAPPRATLGEIGRKIVFTEDITNRELEYFYYIPASVATSKDYQILFCIPGLNGSGAVFMQKDWIKFANRNELVIIAPSFRFNWEDWEKKRSYQFPEVWSGNAMLRMVNEINIKIGSRERCVLK